MSIFDTLISLPLFNGVSHEIMAKAVGRHRFEFKKFGNSDVIVAAGDPCRSLVFILSGRAVSHREIGAGFVVTQELPECTVLSPEFLFGRFTEYPSTVTASDAVSVLEISKADYLEIISSDPVFMFNYLNLLSRKAQKMYEFMPGGTLKQHLTMIVDIYTDVESREIVISCPVGFTKTLGVTAAAYEKLLSALKEKGAVSYYTDTEIKVSDRAAFIL